MCVDSEAFQKRVKNKSSFSDGFHSSGYLWDYLKDYQKISEQAVYSRLEGVDSFFVFADDLSRDHVLDGRLWPFRAGSVAVFNFTEFYGVLDSLP